ncbi:hypothetical protein WDZ92_28600 [Nostoc sp. NIES-2111]
MEEKTSMPSSYPVPGLKRRPPNRLLWVARPDAVSAGYEPKSVRIFRDPEDPDDVPFISAMCIRLQSEMLEWLAGKRKRTSPFDGTVGSLIRLYQTDEASPYQQIKWNTRRTYDQVLRSLDKAVGNRSMIDL